MLNFSSFCSAILSFVISWARVSSSAATMQIIVSTSEGIILSFILLHLLCAERLIACKLLDIGSQHIHEKYGERHTLGIGAEMPDNESYDSASQTEDHFALLSDWSCSVVGSHEECAQEYTACQYLIQRIVTCNP